MPPPETLRTAVLYDGKCRLCLASMTRLRAIDRQCRLDWVDIHDEAIKVRFERLNPDEVRRDLHVVRADGTVKRGSEAVMEVAAVLGGQGGIAVATVARLLEAPTASKLLYALMSATRMP